MGAGSPAKAALLQNTAVPSTPATLAPTPTAPPVPDAFFPQVPRPRAVKGSKRRKRARHRREIAKESYPGVVKATKSTSKRSAPAKASDADTGV